jgi:DNA-binding transcriptional LysR family regulator
MRFSLRHLEVFAGIARQGTISGAADALAMSQSAASAALLELERRYERPLFDRAGKRLRINETGRSLLPLAHEMLDRADEIDALLTGRMGPGSFRLGATQTIGSYVAPLLIEAYSQDYPGRPLTLEIDNSAEIVRKVADFSLDLALVEGEYSHPDLVATEWIGDELVLICNPAHRLAAAETCAIDSLLEERWVVRERGSGTRQALDRVLHAYWARWQIGMELQQIDAIIETVAVSGMIGCVSTLAARGAIAEGRVVELRVPDIDLSRRFYILSHREKYRTPGISGFLQICGDAPALLKKDE